MLVGSLAFGLAALACSAAAGLTGAAYHALVYGGAGPVAHFSGIGFGIACLYAFSFLVRGEYSIASFLAGARSPRRIFTAWNIAFLAAVVVVFVTKTSDGISRGFVLLFYAAGLLAMFAVEAGILSAVLAGLRSGRIASRRIVVVGTSAATTAFIKRLHSGEGKTSGLHIVAIATLSDSSSEPPSQTLTQAASTARKTKADDVIIAVSLENERLIDACVSAFSQLPVSVHLDGTSIADHAVELRVHRLGGATTIALAEQPLSSGQDFAKRMFDLVIGGAALIAFLPLMVLIAVVVRLDTPGPALFRQRRLGRNQRPFTIYKFRSMSVTEDGALIRQATQDDPRITRVGYWLRRLNLDELPQL